MRGGYFEVPRRCFAGDFGATARREWVVLPRNSGGFEWREGAARRFSARRTVPGTRGEKIFKNFLERGGKPENWGCERFRKAVWGRPCIGMRVCSLTAGHHPICPL